MKEFKIEEFKSLPNIHESINEDIVWFIDRFVHATSKYPQKLTKYAVTSILQDIFSRKETNDTSNFLKAELYGFKEYKYLLEQTIKYYKSFESRYNLKTPESILNDPSDENTFKMSPLYQTFIKRINQCNADLIMIESINSKKEISDLEILEIIKILNSSHDNELLTKYKEKESDNSNLNPPSKKDQTEARNKVLLADNSAKNEITKRIATFVKNFPQSKKVAVEKILNLSLEGIGPY